MCIKILCTCQMSFEEKLIAAKVKKNFLGFILSAMSLMYVILTAIFLLIMMFLSLLYTIPVVFVRNFRHRNNLLTINICIAVTLGAIYHIIYLLVGMQWSLITTRSLCHLVEYLRMFVVCQTSYAYITVAVHRYCSIVHFNKPLFKKRRWLVSCITCQWLAVGIISLPMWPQPSYRSVCI